MAVAFLKGPKHKPKAEGCPYEDDFEVEIRGESKQALMQNARRLETVIRNSLSEQNHERIAKIVSCYSQ